MQNGGSFSRPFKSLWLAGPSWTQERPILVSYRCAYSRVKMQQNVHVVTASSRPASETSAWDKTDKQDHNGYPRTLPSVLDAGTAVRFRLQSFWYFTLINEPGHPQKFLQEGAKSTSSLSSPYLPLSLHSSSPLPSPPLLPSPLCHAFSAAKRIL